MNDFTPIAPTSPPLTGIGRRARMEYAWLRMKMKPAFEVGTEACFDEVSTEYFRSLIASKSSLLEYGSGGSTVEAASKGLRVVSMDSDAAFSRQVQKTLVRKGVSDRVTLLTTHIGRTSAWGGPVDATPNEKNFALWQAYTMLPWVEYAANEAPDIVLVDGRMRIACVLYSAIELMRRGKSATLLLDDFEGRAPFKPVLELFDLVAMHGRMAQLSLKPGVTEAVLVDSWKAYCHDVR